MSAIVSIADNSLDQEEFRRLAEMAESHSTELLQIVATASPKNSGYAGGNNFAWRSIKDPRSDAIFVINPDVLVTHGDLSKLADEVRASPDAIFGVRTDQDGLQSSGLARLRAATGESEQILDADSVGQDPLAYPGGHFLALSRSLWESLGGFSEDFFLYAEEVDLALRARANSAGALRASRSVEVAHAGAGSTSDPDHGAKSRLTFFHGSRSRVILYRKHRPLKRFLIPLVVTRFIWAAALTLRGKRDSGSAVVGGLLNGLRWKG